MRQAEIILEKVPQPIYKQGFVKKIIEKIKNWTSERENIII